MIWITSFLLDKRLDKLSVIHLKTGCIGILGDSGWTPNGASWA